jgi:hypothetical protein
MLSVSNSFLFVHKPKTAVIRCKRSWLHSDDILTSQSPWRDGVERFELKNSRYPTSKHATLDEYHRIYPTEMFHSLLKFTVIRNTYERAISYYTLRGHSCGKSVRYNIQFIMQNQTCLSSTLRKRK